jgi:3-hydroxyacyl-CoA dehydrogenase
VEVTRPQDQAVAVLEISALHPFGLSALQTVQSALQAALRDPAMGALVLHIQGPDSLPEVAHALATATASPRTRDAVETLVQCLERADKPRVVALQGFVAGIPLELALACSGRVALDSAQLAVPDVLHGVIPGTGSLQRLVGLLGISQTWELVH